jgi:thioredoxin reductase
MDTEIAIIGSGPAGLAAAIEAARFGARVTVVDENSEPGGQLLKQIHKFFGSEEHRAGVRGIDIGKQLLVDAERLGVRVLLDSVAYGLFDGPSVGLVYDQVRNVALRSKRILIATGATENPLAFPGWTLPGVMSAGAAQTMMNLHRVLPGERILMVGAGNVGLIVAYQFLQAGADVVAVIEAAPQIGAYGVHAAKLRRSGVPILTSTTISRAEGGQRVREATLVMVDSSWQPVPGTEQTLQVDTVCVAVGLTPLIELAALADCSLEYLADLGGLVPIHDQDMRTSREDIYVAGDVTGIEEASSAMEEGRLAGIAMAQSLGYVNGRLATDLKQQAWERLGALREGPFGEKRFAAKKQMLEIAGA